MPIEAETVIVKVVLEVLDSASEKLKKLKKPIKEFHESAKAAVSSTLSLMFAGMALSRAFRGFNQAIEENYFAAQDLSVQYSLMNAYMNSAAGQMEYAMRTGFAEWMMGLPQSTQGFIGALQRMTPILGSVVNTLMQMKLVMIATGMLGSAKAGAAAGIAGLVGGMGTLWVLLPLLIGLVTVLFWTFSKGSEQASKSMSENIVHAFDEMAKPSLIDLWNIEETAKNIQGLFENLGYIEIDEVKYRWVDLFNNITATTDEQGNYVITAWSDMLGSVSFIVDYWGKAIVTSHSGMVSDMINKIIEQGPNISKLWGDTWESMKFHVDKNGKLIIDDFDAVMLKGKELPTTASIVKDEWGNQMLLLWDETKTYSTKTVEELQKIIDKANLVKTTINLSGEATNPDVTYPTAWHEYGATGNITPAGRGNNYGLGENKYSIDLNIDSELFSSGKIIQSVDLTQRGEIKRYGVSR